MTRPDLDALQALLDKNPHDGTDAAQALLALPALIARVRELESYCAGYKKMIDAVTDPAVCEAAADALERLARERDDIREMLQNANRDAARLANIAYKYKWQVRDTARRAERAEAERDRANADAARYRWLRDGDGPQSSRWSRWRIEHWASPGPTWADIRGADLDAAIDAHLKEKP